MWVKILLLFFVFSFLFKSDHSFDQDLGRHIKLGEIITQTHQVPKINLFSYTNPNFPFINTHWLFEVLAFWFNQTIGVRYLLVLKIIIFLVSVWLILKIIPKENSILLLPVGFIFLHVLRERAELRPEIFSFLFTALTIFILNKNNKLVFFLPLIQLIWINTHIYFFVGLLLQAIFIIYSLGVKLSHPWGGIRIHIGILMVVFSISLLLSLINPNGLTGVLYPLNVIKNYGYTIVENQTMSLLESINFRNPNFLFVKLSIGIIVLSLLVALIKRKFDIKSILLSLFGMGLALMNVRSFPYLVFLSLPAVMMNFGPIKKNALSYFLILVTCALLLLESFFYLNGNYYKYREDGNAPGLKLIESGKGAVDFLLVNSLPGPIYNNFDIGSYILYRGYPKYRLFVDGRPEAYPAEFFTGIYIPSQSDYKNFKEIEEIWNFKTIIFSHTDQTPWGKNFLQAVVKDDDWKLVYIDDFILVLVKKEVSEERKLKIVDLSTLNPETFKLQNHVAYLRIALFLFSTGNLLSGREFLNKTLQVFPDSPVANSVMASGTGDFTYLQKSKSIFFW